MATNALLCRYHVTWHEVIDSIAIASQGRREALLSLGAIQTVAEVERIAIQQLAIFARTREQITAQVDPAGASDTPFLSYGIGDTIVVPDSSGANVARRILAIAVDEDEHGELTYTPQLGDILLGEEERFAQATRKMIPGTLAGRSASVSEAV